MRHFQSAMVLVLILSFTGCGAVSSEEQEDIPME